MSKNEEKTITFGDSDCLSKLRQSIVLTVEEARQIQRAIAIAMMATPSISHGKKLSELIDMVADRIKQAEKANGSH